MTVVKCQHAPSMVHDAVVLDLGDLAAQARQMMERAEAEAERIVADARAEAARQAKRITEEAHELGRKEGLEQGLGEGREQARSEVIAEFQPRLAALESRWIDAVDQWCAARGDMLMSVREDVLRLAIALAEKVALRRISQDPTVVQSQVEATLALLSEQSTPTVAVHPDDLKLIEEVMPALQAALSGGAHVALRTDETVDRGGCVVCTQRGEIDARIMTQIESIAAMLLPDGIAPGSVSEEEQ